MRKDTVDPYRRLVTFCKEYRTKTEAATALGISQPYLDDLLRKRRPITDRILSPLGLKRTVIVRER
jgi:hypothetical protein